MVNIDWNGMAGSEERIQIDRMLDVSIILSAFVFMVVMVMMVLGLIRLQQLGGKAIRADLEAERLLGRGHEARRHERAHAAHQGGWRESQPLPEIPSRQDALTQLVNDSESSNEVDVSAHVDALGHADKPLIISEIGAGAVPGSSAITSARTAVHRRSLDRVVGYPSRPASGSAHDATLVASPR